MTNTPEAPKWIVVVRNVLISAGAGIIFGCMIFPWFGAILQATQRGNYALFDFKSLLIQTLTSPFLIFLIAPFLMPLIGMACLAGVIFQKIIERHLLPWCIISPVLVWLAAIAFLVRTPPNQYREDFNWFERFIMDIPNPDHLIFLIAPSFSAFIFYKLSKKGLKWSHALTP